MTYTPGPKEIALKALREGNSKKNRKPLVADVRNKIAKMKPMAKHGGRRGR